MANKNCLRGIKCPSCGYEEQFHICATTMFKVSDDGTDDYNDVEWDDASVIRCGGCSHTGTVGEFSKKSRKKSRGRKETCRTLVTTLAPWNAGGKLFHGKRR